MVVAETAALAERKIERLVSLEVLFSLRSNGACFGRSPGGECGKRIGEDEDVGIAVTFEVVAGLSDGGRMLDSKELDLCSLAFSLFLLSRRDS